MTGLNLYVYIYIHIRVYTCVQQAATDLSVQRLATGWTVQGSNPSRGEIFRNRPDRPWGPPSPYTMGTGFFLGVNWPESGVDHPPHFVPRLKKEQSYTSTPLWAFVACYRVEFYLYYIYIYIHRVSQEECARLREGVPYVKLYRYNPKHLYPNLNGYGDNGQRILKL